MKKETELLVNGKRLAVSNLDKRYSIRRPVSPTGDVINYYIRIAPMLLPHLKDRPLAHSSATRTVSRECSFMRNAAPPSGQPG